MNIILLIVIAVVGYFVIIRPIYKTIYYYKEYDCLIISVGALVLQVISLITTLFLWEDEITVPFVLAVIITVLIFIASLIWNAVRVTKEDADKREFYEALAAQLCLPFAVGILLLWLLYILFGDDGRKKRR